MSVDFSRNAYRQPKAQGGAPHLRLVYSSLDPLADDADDEAGKSLFVVTILASGLATAFAALLLLT